MNDNDVGRIRDSGAVRPSDAMDKPFGGILGRFDQGGPMTVDSSVFEGLVVKG